MPANYDARECVICGEVFSSNLGDQVIALCLRYAILKHNGTAVVSLMDLSGRRTGRARGKDNTNGRALNARVVKLYVRIRGISPALRCALNLITWFGWRRQQVRRAFGSILDNARVLIVGGGQLIADNDLHFPLHINEVTRMAAARGIPIFFLACGVGEKWSIIGKELMSAALRRASTVFVRDMHSKEQLGVNRLMNPTTADRMPDPALLSAAVFLPGKRNSGKRCIGLGVISPSVISRHAQNTNAKCEDHWLELMQCLEDRGIAFELFTNGAGEDLTFAQRLARKGEDLIGRHIALFHPESAEDLVSRLAGYSAVAAYRLHACILCVATAVPVIGLAWDRKLRSFFEEIGAADHAIDFDSSSARDVANRLALLAESSPLTHESADTSISLAIEKLFGVLYRLENQRPTDAIDVR